jgi:14-3-3 protein beta/theta/zeta
LEQREVTQKTRLVEQAELYNMAICTKSMTEQGAEMSNKECNLFPMAFKQVIESKVPLDKTDISDKALQLIKDHREKVEKVVRAEVHLPFCPRNVDQVFNINAMNPESNSSI